MGNPEETLDARVNAQEDQPDKYPLAIRIFGVISIVAGGIQVVSFILSLLAVFFGKIKSLFKVFYCIIIKGGKYIYSGIIVLTVIPAGLILHRWYIVRK